MRFSRSLLLGAVMLAGLLTQPPAPLAAQALELSPDQVTQFSLLGEQATAAVAAVQNNPRLNPAQKDAQLALIAQQMTIKQFALLTPEQRALLQSPASLAALVPPTSSATPPKPILVTDKAN